MKKKLLTLLIAFMLTVSVITTVGAATDDSVYSGVFITGENGFEDAGEMELYGDDIYTYTFTGLKTGTYEVSVLHGCIDHEDFNYGPLEVEVSGISDATYSVTVVFDAESGEINAATVSDVDYVVRINDAQTGDFVTKSIMQKYEYDEDVYIANFENISAGKYIISVTDQYGGEYVTDTYDFTNDYNSTVSFFVYYNTKTAKMDVEFDNYVNDDKTDSTASTASTDATSSVATSDTASTPSTSLASSTSANNDAVQTGETSVAAIILFALLSAAAVAYFVRKKSNF